MHTLLVSLAAAFAASCAAPPQATPDSDAMLKDLMRTELAAIKAMGNEDTIVVRRTAEVVAGMPLDESAMEDAPFAGLRLVELAPETAAQLPIMPGSGLLVSDVVADGPAAGVGMKAMDVIAKVGDQIVVNADQFRVLVRSRKAGDAMPVTVYRGGKEMTVTIPLGSRKQPKLGPGGRIAGAGFETDGDVVVMDAAGGQNARLWRAGLAPATQVATMRGPNGEVMVMVNADSQAMATGNAATPPAPNTPGATARSRTVSNAVYTDEHAKISWTTTNGVDAVVVTDLDADKVVWEGATAPDAAAMASFGAEVRASVQRMLEGRAAAEARRPRVEPGMTLPPAAPARPKPGEASQPAPSPVDT